MSICKHVLFALVVVGLLILAQACVIREFPVTETYEDIEYRTEYQTETYTEVEKVVAESKKGKKIITPVAKWYNSLYYAEYKPIRAAYYYGYFIGQSPHSKNEVVINLSRGIRQFEGIIIVYDLTGIGQIPPQPTVFSQWGPIITVDQMKWIADFNLILGNARQLGQITMGPGAPETITFDARGVWEFAIIVNSHFDHAISYVQLNWVDETIEEKTVTKQRQVPHQVPYKVIRQRTVTEVRAVPFWEVFFK
ncbi:MAG: hypothetical protein FJ008_06940 [Chloroflexi bacterium]|nr:hypothetical protein [Chloroflexota bacterium]MBM4450438.1 hypothetical protein [Chloroflexota bacterium]